MDNQNLFTKLSDIKKLVEECLASLSDVNTPKYKQVIKKENKKDRVASVPILSIVNKIKNCDEFEKIEKEILDKTALAGRILLPFYICYKYFPRQRLTTGDIEKITDKLKAKIQTPNVSKTISKSLHKYLEGHFIPGRNQRTLVYALTPRGAKYFESILNPKVIK